MQCVYAHVIINLDAKIVMQQITNNI